MKFTDRSGNRPSAWEHLEGTYSQTAQGSLGGDEICINTRGVQPGQECWYLPDQLQVLPGQMYRKTLDNLDSELTDKMIGIACKEPSESQAAINNVGLSALGLGDPLRQPTVLNSAGISISTNMITVLARTIAEPHVLYKDKGGNNLAAKRHGAGDLASWTTKDMQFRNVQTSVNGTVVFLCPSDMSEPAVANNYLQGFKQSFRKNGIKLADVVERYTQINDFSLDALKTALTSGDCAKAGLFVLVLPRQDRTNRSRHTNFRVVTDQIVGKPSIVICETKMLGKRSRIEAHELVPYMANNAMKINLRLGNSNHTVEKEFDFLKSSDLKTSDVLILGADLVHPKSTSAEGTPSIAAVVGNVDNDFAKLLGSVRRQAAGAEFIEPANFQTMVFERIKHGRALTTMGCPLASSTTTTAWATVSTSESASMRLRRSRRPGRRQAASSPRPNHHISPQSSSLSATTLASTLRLKPMPTRRRRRIACRVPWSKVRSRRRTASTSTSNLTSPCKVLRSRHTTLC